MTIDLKRKIFVTLCNDDKFEKMRDVWTAREIGERRAGAWFLGGFPFSCAVALQDSTYLMGGLIDLNTVNEDEEDTVNISSSVDGVNNAGQYSHPCSSASSAAVCMELWHACAGPLTPLPKIGSVVVYFPQGHLEHFPDFPKISLDNIPPPHVFCRVLDVKFHAEVATDDVYCQLFLVPEIQMEEKLRQWERDNGGDEEDIEDAGRSTTSHMFCKTLTASDTSTHGGFSVPRRAAEDCFPPLDYKKQRPFQELIAKDLHGLEWRFRHIYRGQPRRHLLTTGWSAFLNKKRLISGDAVLFLRGADGVLRLGIRRAAHFKGTTSLALPNEELNCSNLETVFSAISKRRVFSICYIPRSSLSEFVVPLRRFLRSLGHFFSAGTRFRMRFDAEDAVEGRYTGVITGIGDVDPLRWPGSKWRCLLVRWDDIEANRHSRVSPWEIEVSSSVQGSINIMASGLKRSRIDFPLTKPDFPIPGGVGVSDSQESPGFQKVLQGQEIFGFNAAYHGINNPNHRVSESRSNITDIASFSRRGQFCESFLFQKVLQDRETRASRFPDIDFYGGRRHESIEILEGVGVPSHRNGWSAFVMNPSNPQATSSSLSVQVSSPSSVLMFQQANVRPPNFQPRFVSNHHEQEKNRGGNPNIFDTYCGKLKSMSHSHCQSTIIEPSGGQDLLLSSKTSCRLFGFSLTGGSRGGNDKELSLSPVPSPLSSETLTWPAFEGRPHLQSPTLTKATVGSDCTSDRLLDIAL
ncbi:hypothetical protein Nepgr_028798 [Nepenthes gracilis]|uniref:Auxin response factor n=1 Tax=Nepenthes gracilis TaxID=150966 RepID=A0AAD3Y498_NEPGR|nr:hypothetical protein Nepgr_028798 [Nepenthes gracilis]